jgi:ABC-type multidrug transport system fused ATPase/permease subunit
MNMLRGYLAHLKTCTGLSIATVALAGLAAAAEGVALTALMPIFDVYSGGSQQGLYSLLNQFGLNPDRQQLLILCLATFVVLAILAAVTRGASEILGLWVKARVETTMRQRMTDALLNTTWSHFVKLRQGDIAKAMVIEGMQVGTGAMSLVLAAGSILAAICYLAFSFAVAVDLTLMALAFGGIGGLLYLAAVRGVRHHADRLSQMVGDIGDKSAELFGNLKYFRATGQEQELRYRSSQLFETYGDAYLRSQSFNPGLRAIIEILAALFVAGFLYYHLGHHQGSVAKVLIFLAVFYRMVPRILNAQGQLFQARTYYTWLDTYETRLQHTTMHQLPANGSISPVFEKEIRLEEVSFGYPGESRQILNAISLSIPKGSCIALVGASGGGKTTLADLLTGMLRPTAGQVTVDGVNLNDLDTQAWRNGIGLVMQEPMVLHASVAANVALGDRHADRERVQRALEMANAWDFVQELPQGMDTVIAEKGARLSGGQRQRLSIARSLYHAPRLLMLDEATSALDGEAEERIQDAIEHMKGSTTMVIVAHRLKTVKIADIIVVLNDGRLIELGSWDELIAQGGIFHQMARTQGLI